MRVYVTHEVGLGREADRRAGRSDAGEGAADRTVRLAAGSWRFLPRPLDSDRTADMAKDGDAVMDTEQPYQEFLKHWCSGSSFTV